MPQRPFYSETAGYLDIRDNRTVLVSLSRQGNIWEIDLETGQVLWEYVLVDPQTGRRQPIYTAKYVDNVAFPLNEETDPRADSAKPVEELSDAQITTN